jgi:hypothetical protein
MFRRLAWAAAIGLALPAWAGDAETGVAREILTALAVEAEIEAIRGEAWGYFESHGEQIAPEDRAALREIVGTSFRADTLYAFTLDAFLARYEPARADTAAAWLERPDTRRVLARAALDPGDTTCLEETSLDVLGQSITEERHALLEPLVERAGASARARRRASLVFEAMLVAGNDALPAERRFTDGELDVLLRSQRAGVARAHPTDYRALHCVYLDIDTQTLRDAVAFLGTPAGRWLWSGVETALSRALRQAARATALRIVETFGSDGPPAAPLRVARGSGLGAREGRAD